MEVRQIDDSEVSAWRRCVSDVFGYDAVDDPKGDERQRALNDITRTFAAFDGGLIVGTAAAFDFTLSVPGGSVPMSGLTMVTVRPTHRRRGILRALIEQHLAAARAHGDPVSGLFASQATIYGRFGYGIAVECDELSFSGARVRVAEGQALDVVELLDDAAAATEAPDVYARAFADRPGMFSRSPAWWRYRRLIDRPEHRKGACSRRYVLARRDGLATGYLAFRQKLEWDNNVAAGSFRIDELVALDGRAEATLLRYAAQIDLFPKVSWWNAPVDLLLPWLVDDPHQLERQRSESLWLRIDAVAPTLEARTYGAAGELCLAVDDEPAQLLTIESGRARCVPSGRTPELRLDRPSLGSIYLGAVAPSLLARAGRIEGSATALALADRMFASPRAPWCAEIF